MSEEPAKNVSHIIQLRTLEAREILKHINWNDFNVAQQLNRSGLAVQKNIETAKAEYEVTSGNLKYLVSIRRPDNLILETSCTCGKEVGLCIHKVAALLNLSSHYGEHGLNSLRDLTEEKNKLLAQYGYSLSDDLKGKFDFVYNQNKVFLKLLDPTIRPLPGGDDWEKWKKSFLGVESQPVNQGEFISISSEHNLIYCIVANSDSVLPDISFYALVARQKKNGVFYKKIVTYNEFDEKEALIKDADDADLIELSSRLYNKTVLAITVGNTWNHETVYDTSTKESDKKKILVYIGLLLDKVFEKAGKKKIYVAMQPIYSSPRYYELINPEQNEPYELSTEKASVEIKVIESEEFIELEPLIWLNGENHKVTSFKRVGRWLLAKDQTLYKLASYADAHILNQFIKPPASASVIQATLPKDAILPLRFRSKNFTHFFEEVLKPLASGVKVSFPEKKRATVDSIKPLISVYLSEHEKFLLLTPRFEYLYNESKVEGEMHSNKDLIIHEANTIVTIKRDAELEREYTDFFRSLHPHFASITSRNCFYITFDKVMEGGWFFHLFDKLKEKNIQVYGRNALTKIKYNSHRPVLKMRSSSGIDWFDLKIQVSFGDIEVSLMELRKAFIDKQFYIPLSDGTIGILPEEWIERYATLFKTGKIADDGVQVSKLHFTIIDALEQDIDNEKILLELHEKKRKLLEFTGIAEIPVPKNIKATLRHYQVKGFHWLNFLHEFGWGGCLADDMGLGKTLQVLTLLQHLKNEVEKEKKWWQFGNPPVLTSLVVLPTTLIFNWQAEVEKFCSQMKVHVHRGTDRNDNASEFSKYDIILTTYGTLRSDIELFKDFEFNYVILDESQAIKNPASQISKAVRLLKTKHRLTMTGTPVENNTFDLYAQLEFLNPGFLGSQEFFREEYATAIDKGGDEKKAAQLRRLIAPFVLKRTKEDVATDLPEKTETVLYCEMPQQQRQVYNTFQKKYKKDILDKIATQGLNKTGFLILEGLLKLRQICDSPFLISDSENNYGEESAKLEELIREISENAGHHKILVFSQFLKMLDLVKQKLEGLGISYSYLDGQTVDRKERVDSFQTSDEVRVFLISLKAGGVGINLTEADYVYLIDPWWNPAVERQAIDRTHRIGQNKKVFAYKMICKDTVEEKILKLQDKKKFVASSLIDVDKNVLKKLTKDDIAELFS